jgi:hypothetical protein
VGKTQPALKFKTGGKQACKEVKQFVVNRLAAGSRVTQER